MGSNTSKQSNDSAITQKNDKESASSAAADPRSPTPEITRTPLQRKTDAKHHITKNADLRKTFENPGDEEKLIHNNTILSAVIRNHLQSYDPRSPTVDFERTPIVLTSQVDYHDKMSHANGFGSPMLVNSHLEDSVENSCDSCAEANESPELIIPKNLCNGFMDLTLSESVKEEPLGSSTASNEAIEDNMSPKDMEKQTKLLETNFDYIENIDHNEEKLGDCKPESALSKIPRLKVLKDDPRSPSTAIDRTPIVVAKTSEDDSTENVEEMSDDNLLKLLHTMNTEFAQDISSSMSTSALEGLLLKALQSSDAELHQIDNRPTDNEGLLIYEDQGAPMNDTPKKSKADASSGSRTPLSCMKNKSDTGHARSKSANVISKSHVVDSKVSRRASHIPRLKSLTKPLTMVSSGSTLSLKSLSKVNMQGDCENTPPHSHRDKWDKDSSILL